MRQCEVKRKTAETDISVSLTIGGSGNINIKSGNGFFDHMLCLFAAHGMFDLSVICNGDTYVDYHHSVEDIGITLGQAFSRALGDKKGIKRYGSIILPMDEALIMAATDISGRGKLFFEASVPTEKVGDFDTELVKEFFDAFAANSGMTLHIKKISGENSHHIIEGIFKAVARALRQAVNIDPDAKDIVPSTKGIL